MPIVTDRTGLLSALATASAGDVIELAAGDYGDVVLDGFAFTAAVTIRSQDGEAPAVFGLLHVKNSSFLTFDEIAVTHPLAPSEPDWVSAMRIDKSTDIVVTNSSFSGSSDGDFANDGQGLLALDSSRLTFAGNTFHDLKVGLSVGRSEAIEVRANDFFDIRSDGAVLANVREVEVTGNTFASFHPSAALGDHPDMIQLWNDGAFGEMSDITISGNHLTRGTGGDVQAIFIQGALPASDGSLPPALHDLVISGNVIDGGAAQGIWVSDVIDGHITSNILTQSEGGGTAPTIRTDHTVGFSVDGNTAPQITDVGSIDLVYADNTITGAGASGSTIVGTAGADVIEGTAGADIVTAAAGDDLVRGHDGNDRIAGDDGNDMLLGDGGDDTLNGGGGNDELHGGDGNDGFFGGGGNDRLFGEAGGDSLFGDGGNDMLNGGAGNDMIYGGSGADGVFGGGGNDVISGEAGNDTIYGDGGSDVIRGGAGNDTLFGGSGNDLFQFEGGGGSDQVRDFQQGLDLLHLSGIDGTSSFADLDLTVLTATSTLVSYLDDGVEVSLTVSSATPFTLGATDFLF